MQKIYDAITDILCILLIIADILICVYAIRQIKTNQETIYEIETLIKNSDTPVVIGTTEDDVIIIGDPNKITLKNKYYGTANEPRK